MIRFIWIGAQINDDGEEFAFYDTIKDKFMCFAGEQVFDDLDDFRSCCVDKILEARCVELVRNNHPTKYFTFEDVMPPLLRTQYLSDADERKPE